MAETGWIFLIIIFALMALFAISVYIHSRKQQDPDFYAEDE